MSDMIGPGLYENKRWGQIERALSEGALAGIISKLEIGDHDVYLKTSWWEGSIIRIDLTLSGRLNGDSAATPREVTLETTNIDLARSSCEMVCKQASEMLQSGIVGIGHVIDDWIGRNTYPSGYCPQIPGVDESGNTLGATFQKGPVDAAAKYMKLRIEEWSELMAAKER